MTLKQKFYYFLIALVLFVVLALFEYFILSDFMVLLTSTISGRVIAYALLLVLFNPFIVYKIMELIPFKVKGLKTDKGLKETFKREIE